VEELVALWRCVPNVEAWKLLAMFPIKSPAWCNMVFVDVEMGECMAKRIRGMPCGFASVAQVDPGNAAGYVLALLKHLCCGLQAGMSVRSC
jgi:hypothetical protein